MITIKEKCLVREMKDVKTILKNINWNFNQKYNYNNDDLKPFKSSKYHWYPSTFIPEIPYTLIELLTYPNAVVFDPYAGIGTTFFQALLLNRRPLATDICYVSIMFMKSLLLLFDPKINFKELKYKIDLILDNYDSKLDYIKYIYETKKYLPLEAWFSKKTFNKISFLIMQIDNTENLLVKSSMQISISAILKKVSSQKRGIGCISDNVLPKSNQYKDIDVLTILKIHINKLLSDISSYSEKCNNLLINESIFHVNINNCYEICDNSVDLVITSPPYPNMTDYVTSQRLSYYFYGYDLNKDLLNEIGARRKRFRKDSLDKYFEEMRKANSNIVKKIKLNGYACFIMPEFEDDTDNDKKRKKIINKLMLEIEKTGLIKEGEYNRVIPLKKRERNNSWVKLLEREKIYLFRKE